MKDKYIAVADHPYYPEVEEFEDEHEAGMWLEEKITELADQDGENESEFYLAKIEIKETYNTLC